MEESSGNEAEQGGISDARPAEYSGTATPGDTTSKMENQQNDKKESIVDPTLAPEIAKALATLNMRTIVGRLQRHWITEPDKEIFVFYDDHQRRSTLTNQQLRRLVEGCSSLLRCNGVRKGDVVCNALDVSPEREVVTYAILCCGAIQLDGLSLKDQGSRFWTPLVKANVQHIVVDPNDDGSIVWSMVASDVAHSYADIERATIKELPCLEKIFKFRMQHLMAQDEADRKKTCFELIYDHEGTFVEVVNSYDPAVLFVRRTVSEGIYKMVMRSHLTTVQMSQRSQEMLKLSKDDIVYADWSMAWVFGISLSYISTGTTMVKSTLHNCPAPLVVRETWELIENEHCTMASLEPPMIIMLASHCEDLPTEHWTLTAITTSGDVKPAVMDAIGCVTDSVIICYSVIEAGMVSRLVVTEANKRRFSVGCVGELTDPKRTRLDIKTDGCAQPTKIGEILIKGKLVCKEYHNDPYLTSASFTSDGYLKTGDLGFYNNEHGPLHDTLFVLGRKSQAILRGDTAIFPRDIEEKVSQCPGIWKVSIVSIRDEKGVTQMCACVIPRSQESTTIEGVKEFCRYQLGGTADDDDNPHMPTYVFFFTNFPMLGKEVDKHTLAHTTAMVVKGTDEI